MEREQSTDGEVLCLPSPGKINLMLSVHGKREDGYHELTSLVAPLHFGDELSVAVAAGADALACNVEGIPLDRSNLILRAADVFREYSGLDAWFAFELTKRIPVGAGLGGGSSNAATALLGMNRLCGDPLDHDALTAAAAVIGSDCPFFIDPRPSLMKGRGETLEPLGAGVSERLRGMEVYLFRPPFAVSTAWAYGALASSGSGVYDLPADAEERLDRFFSGGSVADLLHNSFLPVVGGKYLAIPALLGSVSERLGMPCLMSGSGSCCFALPASGAVNPGPARMLVEDAWGPEAFWVETSLT